MTTEQLDALLRRLDVPSAPDPSFVLASSLGLAGHVRSARRHDATWLGRLRRDLRPGLAIPASPAGRRLLLVAAAGLLAIAVFAGLLLAGMLHRPGGVNGLLIVSVGGRLEAVDPQGGGARSLLPSDERADGVSRSPDGRLATFWVNGSGRSHLYVIGVDGRDRRELAADMSLVWDPSIDTWSPDSRLLATEVTLDGIPRILVVNVETGAARAITPAGIKAHNPLWSPDGQSVAFSRDASVGHTLTVVRSDGTGVRDVAGLGGLDPNGPDTWSPDGRWIYFGAGDMAGPWCGGAPCFQHAFRVDVLRGTREQLSRDGLYTPAVASSPDGARIVFNVAAGSAGWDLWIANSDGTAAHRLLRTSGAGSWSADGQLILAPWRPRDAGPGGLVTIRPDGSLTVVVPFDSSCPDASSPSCGLTFGWGQARP